MQMIYLDKGETGDRPAVATMGFFDGVHLGHRYLISEVIKHCDGAEGLRSMAVTFDKHPRQVLHKDFQPKLLTTAEEKRALLEKTGVDCCAVLHFDADMAAMSAEEFMRSVLLERLSVRRLLIGYDHRFGHNRTDGFNDYVRYGQQMGIEVIRANAFTLNGVNVSSSVVRNFLAEGHADMARMCLGYPYFITGSIVGGFREGRKMGFPTANIVPCCTDKIIPSHGVYAVKVRLEGHDELLNGMMNIGHRPTFGGKSATLEVNIFGFSGDIYGQTIDVLFFKKLRDERQFNSIEALVEQLKEDEREVKRIFN